MIIDTFDLEDILGLKLLRVDKQFDLPKRKNILREPGVNAGDIVLDEKKIEVRLYGSFPTEAYLRDVTDALVDILDSSQQHVFSIPEHSITVIGVCRDGFRTELRRTVLKVSFIIYIVP